MEETVAEMRERIFSRIPTVAAESARPRATPKHELKTKLDRVVEKKAADRADERLLTEWAKTVKDRDEWKDRKTGKKVRRTHVLAPDSAHAHHIASREDEAVRYDPRNGITLSFETHDKVERNKLRIVGTKFFKKNGKRYIDGSYPVRWKVIA